MNARLPYWVRATAWFALVLLYVPMIAIAVLSINAGRHGFAWRGFTWDWYTALAQNDAILAAASPMVMDDEMFMSRVLGVNSGTSRA